MLAPVRGYRVVNVAGLLIEDGRGIAIFAHGAVDRLPDVVLLAGTAVVAQRGLVLIHATLRDCGVAEIVAHGRLLNRLVCAGKEVSVLLTVEINVGVGVKVDGIRASCEGAVVVVRVKDLHGKRFPSACRAAGEEVRPSIRNRTELLHHRGHQLCFDGFTVRPKVCGIDCVGIVIVGVGVLHLDDEEARVVFCGPLLVEVIRFLLLDAVIAREMKAVRVVGLQLWIRSFGAEFSKAVVEVIVKKQQRKMGIRMFVETLWNKHRCG